MLAWLVFRCFKWYVFYGTVWFCHRAVLVVDSCLVKLVDTLRRCHNIFPKGFGTDSVLSASLMEYFVVRTMRTVNSWMYEVIRILHPVLLDWSPLDVETSIRHAP